MKINWFSPLPPAHTDIANFSLRVLPELAQHAEVTVWSDQPAPTYPHLRRFSVSDLPYTELSSAVNIFNLGNNAEFHRDIFSVMRRVSGIVILHDPAIFELFASTYLTERGDINGYLGKLQYYYGESGAEAGEDFAKAALRGMAGTVVASMAERFPMTPLALERAEGVVTHSRTVEKELAALGLFPVKYAPLPFDLPSLPPNFPPRTGPLRLIVFGYIGANRGVEQILRALAGVELVELDIYGEIWDESFVRKMIRELGLEARVRTHGYVTEDLLDQAIAGADLAINLRSPSVGEASGAQLRIWAGGCPSIVSRKGWYAELDPKTVLFAEPGRELEELQGAIRRLETDRHAFDSIAAAGYRHVVEKHSPADYARSIIELCERRLKGPVDHRQALRELTSREDAAEEAERPRLGSRYAGLRAEWKLRRFARRLLERTRPGSSI